MNPKGPVAGTGMGGILSRTIIRIPSIKNSTFYNIGTLDPLENEATGCRLGEL